MLEVALLAKLHQVPNVMGAVLTFLSLEWLPKERLGAPLDGWVGGPPEELLGSVMMDGGGGFFCL